MNHTTVKAMDTIRKAAILISALDQHSADELLEKMGERQASKVRNAVMELNDVSHDEQHRVIQQFIGHGSAKNDAISDAWNNGIELDGSLARRLSSPHSQEMEAEFSSEAPPFRFLHEASEELLVGFLRLEHPQTIAVVVSHLPPDRAGDVITRLPTELRADVLYRVANLDEMDAKMVKEIERELESLLFNQVRTTRRRSAGLKAVNAILATVESRDREDLLENLNLRDDKLVSKLQNREALNDDSNQIARLPSREISLRGTKIDRNVRRKRVALATSRTTSSSESPVAQPSQEADDVLKHELTSEPTLSLDKTNKLEISRQNEPLQEVDFHDLAQLNNQELAAVFREATPQLTLLALTGARREFAERVFKQLSPRDANALREKMEKIGPLRLRDIEQAQRQLARLASQLAACGSISLPIVKRFAMAA